MITPSNERRDCSRRLDELLAPLRPVSLDELDRRAALLRRIDQKYVLAWEEFAALIEEIGGDHDVLEINGQRVFQYASVYFDSPDLRCFRDHVAEQNPRFKARTRHYRDTGCCQFEVKLRREGELDKRQVDHPPQQVEQLTPDAQKLLEETLATAELVPPPLLRPTLRTSFHRVTLAADADKARLTCDLGVTIERIGGDRARIRDDLVLVESKTEDGRSRADRVLADFDQWPISLSKYRIGIELLAGSDRSESSASLRQLFGR
jgi:VTC domain